MANIENNALKNAPFLFMVDDGESRSGGLVAYVRAIRTSVGCGGVDSKAALSAKSAMKWMSIYSEDGGEPEQHALVWHTACFAF